VRLGDRDQLAAPVALIFGTGEQPLPAEVPDDAAALARITAAPADRLAEFETLMGEIKEHFAYEESTLVPALLADL